MATCTGAVSGRWDGFLGFLGDGDVFFFLRCFFYFFFVLIGSCRSFSLLVGFFLVFSEFYGTFS